MAKVSVSCSGARPSTSKIKYASRRARATKSTYLISKLGHVMVADAGNRRLIDRDLGGVACRVSWRR